MHKGLKATSTDTKTLRHNLTHIEEFINQHHVLTLATNTQDGELSVCNLFYVYDSTRQSFVFASDEKTTHMQNIQSFSNRVAGGIVLETKEVGKIQGLQFRADVISVKSAELKKLYFTRYPYALALAPRLWECCMKWAKLTDNRFGFGKKVVWEKEEV
jgi:uncharacterized protein YhbP (UPF0306 family)